MNRGLKEIYNQISDSSGLINYKLNLYNPDNNLFINIPLFNNNINLSLIYNHQNRNDLFDCGKGFKMNYYSKFMYNSNGNSTLEKADRTITLESSSYTSITDESSYVITNLLINHVLTITDFKSNIVLCANTHNYPSMITLRNGYRLDFDLNDTKLEYIKYRPVDSNLNIIEKLEFTYKENTNLISKIEYKDSNDILINYVEFEYNDTSNLTKIRYKSNQNVEVARLEFEYNSSYLLITTYDSNVPTDEFKYNFNSNNKITSIYDKFDLINSFTYYNEYTVVSDKYNNQIEYHFKDNKLSYTKDSYSNITYFEYDIFERLILNINNINLLDNTYNMISNISSSYYFNLNPNNKYMLIILTNNQITLTLKGTIYSNSNEDDIYFYEYKTFNGLRIFNLNVYDLNEIFISNSNYVEKIILIKNKEYTKYEYNNKSYITKIETLGTYTLYTYDTNGNMLTSNDGITSYNYTYDERCNMLTKTDSYTTDYYTYDEYNNKTKHYVVQGNTHYPSNNMGYISNNLLYESLIVYENDTCKPLNKFQYTTDLKISKIFTYFKYEYDEYEEFPTTEYTYDSQGRITKLRNISYENVSSPSSAIYNIDINKTYVLCDLKKTSLHSQSNNDITYIDYSYEYDLYKRLIGIKYNHDDFNNPYSDIVFISYNPNNDIYTYNMYGNIYEYNYNLNSSINNIKLNNNLICSYLYDNKNNLIRLNDNLLNSYITYSYDLENRINHMEIYGMNKYVKYDERNRISELRYQNNYFNQSTEIIYDEYIIKSRDYNIDFRYDYIIFENGLESINHKHELDESNYYKDGIYVIPNTKISYRFSEYNTNEFTIFLEMNNINTIGKIVEFNDSNHYIIIENINNNIIIKIDNNTYNTNYSITSGLFNIFMTYGKTEEEIDNDGNYETYNDYKFIFERNNQRSIYSYRLNSFNYSNIKTIIYKPIKYLTYEDSFNDYYSINVYNKMKDNKYNESELKYTVYNQLEYYKIKDLNSNYILNNSYSYDDSSNLNEVNYNSINYKNTLEYNDRQMVIKNKIENSSNSLEVEINYEYDSLGRITKEEDIDSNIIEYTYYNNGDIKTYNNKLYEYENGILVSIDNNPLTYTNKYFLHTYLGKTYNWSNNRLSSYNDGNTTYYYEYDYKGLRRKKIYNNITTTYYYDDNNRLMYERKVNSNQVTEISYIYDMKELIGFKYNDNRYYYIKDILGNIIYIINENKNIMATYRYNSYGIITYEDESSTIAGINHFKYKSYYYDEESNMYYLITRYYLPSIGRFISPDNIKYINIDNINGYNLYAYCNNNPVVNCDPDGKFVITLGTILWGGVIAGLFGAGIAVGATAYNDYKKDGIWFNEDWTDYVGSFLGGFVKGFGVGIAGVLGGAIGAAAFSGTVATLFATTGVSLSFSSALVIGTGTAAVTGTAGYLLRSVISRTEKFNVKNLIIETGFNAISGFLSVLGGSLAGYAGVYNSISNELTTNSFDFVYRLLVKNVFTLGFKISLAYIKSLIEEII